MNFTNTSLFVGDLPKFCNEMDLEQLFSSFGPILDVKIKRNINTGKTLSYGFVTFANEASASEALRRVDGTMFYGRKLRLRWAMYNARSQNPINQGVINSVYVRFSTSRLDQYITEEDLHRVFEGFGHLMDVSIKESSIDPRMNRQSGYGFVHFSCDTEGIEAAFQAVSAIDNATIDGVTYNVELSKNLLKQFNELRQAQENQQQQALGLGSGSQQASPQQGGVPDYFGNQSDRYGRVPTPPLPNHKVPPVAPQSNNYSVYTPNSMPPSSPFNTGNQYGYGRNSGVAMNEYSRTPSPLGGSAIPIPIGGNNIRGPSPVRLPPQYPAAGSSPSSSMGMPYQRQSPVADLLNRPPSADMYNRSPGLPKDIPMGNRSRENSVYQSPQQYKPPTSPGLGHLGNNMGGGIASNSPLAQIPRGPPSRNNSFGSVGSNPGTFQSLGPRSGYTTGNSVRSASPSQATYLDSSEMTFQRRFSNNSNDCINGVNVPILSMSPSSQSGLSLLEQSQVIGLHGNGGQLAAGHPSTLFDDNAHHQQNYSFQFPPTANYNEVASYSDESLTDSEGGKIMDPSRIVDLNAIPANADFSSFFGNNAGKSYVTDNLHLLSGHSQPVNSESILTSTTEEAPTWFNNNSAIVENSDDNQQQQLDSVIASLEQTTLLPRDA